MPNSVPGQAFEVLLVEDDPEDIDRATDACTRADLPLRLRISQDGETMALLRREGPYHDAPRPQLILLDLDLRMGDAIDLLCEIKEDTDLQSIPVVMLGPQREEAIDISFEHAADLYITKPLDSQRLAMTVNWAHGL